MGSDFEADRDGAVGSDRTGGVGASVEATTATANRVDLVAIIKTQREAGGRALVNRL